MPMILGETVAGLLAPMQRANLGFWTEKFTSSIAKRATKDTAALT